MKFMPNRFTWRWMWKLIPIFRYGTVEHSHIMYWTRPSSYNKGEPHVKVTNCQHILCSVSMPPRMLYNLTSWYHNFDMGTIYCSYTIVEKGSKPTFLWSGCTVLNSGSNGLIISAASLTRHVRTLLNMFGLLSLLTSWTDSLLASWTVVHEPSIGTLLKPL